MFQTNVVEKLETLLFSIPCFENHAVYNLEKRCGAGQATAGNMVHEHCMLAK
jgi:hypothetical protein